MCRLLALLSIRYPFVHFLSERTLRVTRWLALVATAVFKEHLLFSDACSLSECVVPAYEHNLTHSHGTLLPCHLRVANRSCRVAL